MEFREYFKSELEYLKQLAKEHVHENPEFAAFLMRSAGEKDIKKWFEHFVFLSRKLYQKLDDAFPEIIESLLSKIFPLPSRSLPATTILKCTPKNNHSDNLIKKGSEVKKLHQFDNDDKPQEVIFQFSRVLNVIALEVSYVETTHVPEGLILNLECHWFGDLVQAFFGQTRPLTFYLGKNSHKKSVFIKY